MHSYFLNTEFSDVISFDKSSEAFNYFTKVLRLKINDIIYLVDINGIYFESKITLINSNEVSIEKLSKLDINNEFNINVSIAIPLLKKHNHELVIEKATELGVNNIYIYPTENQVVKLDDKKNDKKLFRFNEIAKNAAKQCKRNSVPNVMFSTKEEIVKKHKNLFYAYELMSNSKSDFKNIINNLNEDIVCFFGPEGGFDKKEVNFFDESNCTKISLGKRILRAETAPITFLSFIVYNFEI